MLATAEHASVFGRDRIHRDAELLHPSAREFLLAGLEVSADDYLAARRRRFEAVARLDMLLAGGAALVTPTWPKRGGLRTAAGPGSSARSRTRQRSRT